MLLADILKSDPDFLKKLPHYKTAYCPAHRKFVGIVRIIHTVEGEPIVCARLAYGTKVYHFNVEELTDYVL